MRRPLRLGLELPALGVPATSAGGPVAGSLDACRAAVAAAEDAGFDAVWLADRPGPAASVADAVTLAGGLADAAATLTVGVIADVVDARHPAVLARDLTCLDVVSGGRAALLLHDSDPTRPGPDEPGPADALGRLGEASAICRSLLSHAGSVASPRYFRFGQVNDRPRPVQPGGPGIVVQLGPAAERGVEPVRGARSGAGGLVACLRSADAVVTGGSIEQVRSARDLIDVTCSEAGLGTVPALLWRGVLPATSRNGEAALTRRVLSSAGVDGVIVGLARSGPPRPDEVGRLARWGTG